MVATLWSLPGVLDRLPGYLEPALAAAGFVQSDAEPRRSGHDSDEIRLLEYRASIRGRLMILGFCEVPREQIITAELWEPERLLQSSVEISVASVADQYVSWLRQADVDDLIGSITETISTWIQQVA